MLPLASGKTCLRGIDAVSLYRIGVLCYGGGKGRRESFIRGTSTSLKMLWSPRLSLL